MKILVSSFSDKVFVNDLKKNVNLVNEFVKDGNMFIIVSGKNISNIKKTLKDIDLKCSFYICNDGATVFDDLMDVVYRVDIKQDYVRAIYDVLLNSKYITDVKIDVSTGFVDDYMRAANKIVAKYNNRSVAVQIANGLNQKFSDLHAYVTTNYLNITSNSVSKGLTLQYLLDYYHLNNNSVYAIVKNQNDNSLSNYECYVIDDIKGNFHHSSKSFEDAIRNIAMK